MVTTEKEKEKEKEEKKRIGSVPDLVFVDYCSYYYWL